jgi:hypothetical protein
LAGNEDSHDPQQNTAIPDELRNRANDVLERLFALDDAVANARAFRATLEELHRRDLTVVQEPHISSIAWCGRARSVQRLV